DAAAAVRFTELLRQMRGIAFDEDRADTVREPRDLAHARLSVERHDDVEALRSGGLHEAGQGEPGQKIAKPEGRGAQEIGLIFPCGIEIEDAHDRVIEVRYARRTIVRRDAVL